MVTVERAGFTPCSEGWQPAQRWKAPRVRRIPALFAEERMMRPWVESLRSNPERGCSCPRWSLQPVRQRFHDERCPSGSGWGKTLLPVARKGDAAKRGGPRQEGRSWPVKSRLVSVRAGFIADRKVSEGPARRHHPSSEQGLSLSREASVTCAGAACEPRGSGAGERSARAHARAARDGDRTIVWACSRVVVVAEVDERRLVQTERSGV